MQKDHDVRQSKGSRIVDRKASKESLAEDVDTVNIDLSALEVGPVLYRVLRWLCSFCLVCSVAILVWI